MELRFFGGLSVEETAEVLQVSPDTVQPRLEAGQGMAGARDGEGSGERGVMSDRWQEVEELYHAAREDRAVLDKADPELRQEVESLLAQEKGADFLEAPVLELAAQQFAAHRSQSLIGREIGSYQILSLLGAGGMDI